MSGFVGLADLSGSPIDENLFTAFVDAHKVENNSLSYTHRNTDGSLLFASVRNDLFPPTAQTRWSQDDNSIFFVHGEIFNEDLQNIDDLHRSFLESEGAVDNYLTHLNGSFLIAHIDKKSGRLLLACDRSASLPLYYAVRGNLFAFGSRMKPFTSLPGSRFKLNPEAVSNFLTNGFILDGNTLLRGLKVLKPAEYFILQQNEIKERRYWRYSFSSEGEPKNERDLKIEFSELIFNSVKKRTSDGIPFGVLLSGGYDSRAILGCVRKLHADDTLNTITWGEEENILRSDAFVSRNIAEYIGSKHTFYRINPEKLVDNFRAFVKRSEGRTDSVGNYPENLAIFDRIRENLRVGFLLRGDEIFGWKSNVNSDTSIFHSLDIHEMRNLPRNFKYLLPEFRRKLIEASHEQIQQILSEVPYKDLHNRKDYLYFNQRLFCYLNPLSHLKQQAIWMRNPFLDNDIQDFVGKLPTRLRLDKALFKLTVGEMFPQFGRFEIAQQSNLVDWDAYIKKDLRLQNYLKETLLLHENGFDRFLDKGKLEAFLGNHFTHRAADISRQNDKKKSLYKRARGRLQRSLGCYTLSPSTELFRLMILKIFADEFLDGEFDLG
ncbi:hypothetical protein CEE37_06645 [candidate division LCP-89 bacterium B3_LCP]|uniref:asparagine synthase (glutamine-hydrolyzing) n=1 Tax=candidate division LCP-89 bacterium B3_LCP TaxID=2012998 RepID=A0A532V0Z7_UNCL8|nr:MAG: hypothetical protein CEE37_06645 [candidate division LCP-89 bacterium B3_LCP]